MNRQIKGITRIQTQTKLQQPPKSGEKKSVLVHLALCTPHHIPPMPQVWGETVTNVGKLKTDIWDEGRCSTPKASHQFSDMHNITRKPQRTTPLLHSKASALGAWKLYFPRRSRPAGPGNPKLDTKKNFIPPWEKCTYKSGAGPPMRLTFLNHSRSSWHSDV